MSNVRSFFPLHSHSAQVMPASLHILSQNAAYFFINATEASSMKSICATLCRTYSELRLLLVTENALVQCPVKCDVTTACKQYGSLNAKDIRNQWDHNNIKRQIYVTKYFCVCLTRRHVGEGCTRRG